MEVDYRCISLPNTNTFVGNWIFISISDARDARDARDASVMHETPMGRRDAETRRPQRSQSRDAEKH